MRRAWEDTFWTDVENSCLAVRRVPQKPSNVQLVNVTGVFTEERLTERHNV
uniref:Uncharacterized protein n=1 Tax=Populus trichocarpa x Populus deltoides TaxID=3695 RepID=A9PJZ1_9ROSI|nr:unknown [Populus trichocarpa x Populus deltoides]